MSEEEIDALLEELETLMELGKEERKVLNEALKEEMGNEIHALSIETKNGMKMINNFINVI